MENAKKKRATVWDKAPPSPAQPPADVQDVAGPVKRVDESEVATLFKAIRERHEERLAAEEGARRAAAALAERRLEEDQERLLAWRTHRASKQSELLRTVVLHATVAGVLGLLVGVAAGFSRNPTRSDS